MKRVTLVVLALLVSGGAFAYPTTGSEDRFVCPEGLSKVVEHPEVEGGNATRLSCKDAAGLRQGPFLEYGVAPAGRYHVQGQHKDDVPDGLWRAKNNTRNLEVDLAMGALTGLCRRFRDGVPVENVHLRGGVVDGEWVQFDGRGQLRAALTYRRGVAHGLLRVYDRRGALRELAVYEGGKLVDGSRIYLSPKGEVESSWAEARTREGFAPPERPPVDSRAEGQRPQCATDAERALTASIGWSRR